MKEHNVDGEDRMKYARRTRVVTGPAKDEIKAREEKRGRE